MRENQPRSRTLLIVGVAVVVVAVAIWLGILAFGSDSPSPTTTSPTTTAAPTTTTESTETTATTAPEAEADQPDLVAVEVDDDLERVFPVAAGWIVEPGDDSVTVGLSVGSQDCYGLAMAEVEETPDEVLVTVAAGFHPDAAGCGDPAPDWTYEFPLSEPLGDRPVVDAHTGEPLGTDRPDPEEG